MIYGSVCSGLGGCALAVMAAGLDWRCAWFTEIDKFASALLKERFPHVENLGDFTNLGAEHGPVDLLVGGTPCQAFSIAGKRAGMDDARGNLTLEYLALAGRLRPRWLVWENVPGVLLVDDGRAFGTVLGRLVELGYGFAWRVFDAQHAGVPQRRRRVFLVGYFGDWRRAAAVLVEPESLRGDSPPSREAGQDVAGTIDASAGDRDENDAADGRLIAHSLRADGFDASEDGTGRGTPIIALNSRQDPDVSGDVTHPLDRDGHSVAVAFAENSRAEIRLENGDGGIAGALKQGGGKPGQGYPAIASRSGVRRLTPLECERLQGLPDHWTAIIYRGKPAKDGPRYRAIGNGWAIPDMAWIFARIDAMERAGRELDARAAVRVPRVAT